MKNETKIIKEIEQADWDEKLPMILDEFEECSSDYGGDQHNGRLLALGYAITKFIEGLNENQSAYYEALTKLAKEECYSRLMIRYTNHFIPYFNESQYQTLLTNRYSVGAISKIDNQYLVSIINSENISPELKERIMNQTSHVWANNSDTRRDAILRKIIYMQKIVDGQPISIGKENCYENLLFVEEVSGKKSSIKKHIKVALKGLSGQNVGTTINVPIEGVGQSVGNLSLYKGLIELLDEIYNE